MNLKEKESNTKKIKSLVNYIGTERRIKNNDKINYLFNYIL